MPTNIFDMQDTWNAGGVQFYAIKMNVNPVAFAAGSRLLDLQVNAVSRFAVDPTNGVNVGNATGGMLGPGTVNAKGYFVDGASFTASFAPIVAEYITSTDTGVLPNDRVLTDSASIHWDRATPGQIKAITMIGGGNVSTDGVITVGQYAKWSTTTTIQSVPNSTVVTDIGAVAKTGDTMTGNLTISKAAPALILQKASGPANVLGLGSAGLARWSVVLGNGTPEGGGDTGSDFTINRYNDAGTVIDVAGALAIDRASGRVTLAGDLTISKASPVLSIGSSVGNGDIVFKNGTSARWHFRGVNPASETGANAGSNLGISRYDDGGILIDNALLFNRATAAATLTGDLTITKASPIAKLNKTSTTTRAKIEGDNNGVGRWSIVLGNETAETGSDAGSDFWITRFTDAGSEVGVPLSIARSTGIVGFAASPTAPTPAAADNSLKLATTAFVKGLGLGRIATMQVFATSGTYTPSAGTMNVIVFYKGGGGGGGGAGAGLPNSYGGGGGGEGELRMAVGQVASFAGLAVTIGAGGAYPFAFDTDGGNGGNTTVAGIVAAGGAGGVRGNFGGSGGAGGRGGTGGFGIMEGANGHAGTNVNLSNLAWASGGGHGAGGQNLTAANSSGGGGGGGTNTPGGNGGSGFVLIIELL